MPCGCTKIHTTLVCTNCGATQHLSYKEKEEPLNAAKKQGKRCKQCESQSFTIKDS